MRQIIVLIKEAAPAEQLTTDDKFAVLESAITALDQFRSQGYTGAECLIVNDQNIVLQHELVNVPKSVLRIDDDTYGKVLNEQES